MVLLSFTLKTGMITYRQNLIKGKIHCLPIFSGYYSFYVMIIIENNFVGEDVKKESAPGTSLAVQWLRLCLPMQGVQVQSLVGELSLAAKA